MIDAPAPTQPFVPKVDDRVTIGNNPTPGTIIGTRKHQRTGVDQFYVQRDGEKGTHWVIAEALKPVAEAAPADAIEVDVDETPAPLDPNTLPPRRLTPDEYAAAFATAIADDMQTNVDAITAALNRATEAEAHADAETKRANKLEQKVRELETMCLHPQPVSVAQSECWETVTIEGIFNRPEANAEFSRYLNDKWEVINITIATSTGGSDVSRYVTMKRKVGITPPAPQRTTSAYATPAATLTGDEVRAERMKQGLQQQVIEHPVTLNHAPTTASEVLDKWRGVFKEFTAEEVSENLERIALENALENHRARVAAQPDYSTRPLLLTVAVPS